MKILLLYPNYDSHVVHPPLGLGYLASYLETKGHRVSIFDGTLHNASMQDFVKEISKFKPKLIGISVVTRGHNRAKEMIKVIRRKYKKIPIVIGGSQVTAAPEIVIKDLGADYAIVGEGELTLLELVNALEKEKNWFSQIKGLVYKMSAEKIKINPERELISDLDILPFPAWHLMPPKKYRIAPILEPAHGSPVAPILTTRGCPYNCSFCASNITWKRKLRQRSVENVIGEIKLLKEKYGVREIHLCDDNFTMDIKRAEKMCDAFINEKVNLPWQCPNGVRIDRLTPELLRKMKTSGCYSVGLGIESGNEEMLKKISKHLDLKIVPKVLKMLHSAGIEAYGFFILGLPGETRETANETINFALQNSFDRVWFNIFTPYPGSSAFSEWIGNKKFSEIDWDKHDCSTAVMASSEFSIKEIEKLQKQAIRKFFFRPKTFFKVIKGIGPKEIISLLMSRFARKFFNPLYLLVHKTVR